MGNELGMKVGRIADSPLAALNGARFRLTFNSSDVEDSQIILRLNSQQAVKLKKAAELPQR